MPAFSKFLPALLVLPLPTSLAFPTSSSVQLANTTSLETRVAPVNSDIKDVAGAAADLVTANVTIKASDIVLEEPGTLKMVNGTLPEATASSSTFNATLAMTSPAASEELKSSHIPTPPAVERNAAKAGITGFAANESTFSCPTAPSQIQDKGTTSTGSGWGFGLSELIDFTFGLAQTVLAILPAMVAWNFLHEHPAAAAHV
jgi:hypothetical protein